MERKAIENPLSYRIFRSQRRRKTISLHIQEDGSVVVYAPYRTPEWEIERFIESKRTWISEKVLEKKTALKEARKTFLPGERFLYLGELYPLEIRDAPHQKPFLSLSFGKFILSNDRLKEARALFIEWYKKEAREKLAERIVYYSPRLQLFPRGMKITSARSRWGSCSRDDRLCFSWRIIMAPLIVIDYILIHELVHIQEKNHSQRFWGLLGSILPDYREHRRWLREKGHLLNL